MNSEVMIVIGLDRTKIMRKLPYTMNSYYYEKLVANNI